MDKDFRDLLVRYLNGRCTPEEIEKVNRWYEEIADNRLHLETEEQQITRTRILSNIRRSLAEYERPTRKHRLMYPKALVRIAAAVAVLMIVGLWRFGAVDSSPSDQLTEALELPDVVTFENETDATRIYSLPDGSTVELSPSSRIQFSGDFSEGSREVTLTGKAFFDIAKDTSRPFYVYSREIATRVLGTSFLVDAPLNGGKLEVQVITGKVAVFQIKPESYSESEGTSTSKNSTANGVVLSPNQKVEYYTEEDHWVTGLVESPVPVRSLDEHTLTFVFENATMNAVLADIYFRFGIEVVTENDKVGLCTFTGDVSRMTLYDMLDVISNSIGSTYEVKGTRILMNGPGCD